jgi:hypothetical protein
MLMASAPLENEYERSAVFGSRGRSIGVQGTTGHEHGPPDYQFRASSLVFLVLRLIGLRRFFG